MPILGRENLPDPETERSRNYSYIGAYAKLIEFLKECRADGCAPLDDVRYDDLSNAVESLVAKTTGARQLQEHFRGHEHQAAPMLKQIGVNFDDVDEKPKVPRKQAIYASRIVRFVKELEAKNKVPSTVEKDVVMICHAFSSPMPLVDKYKIEVEKLAAWNLSIASQYLHVPYHNWGHALDVFWFLYLLLFQGRASDFFNNQDVLALFVAALGHDVGHFGLSNGFLVATRSKLALTYNDRSVLENMHATKLFETIRTPGMDFLIQMNAHDYSVFRGKVICAILATDMAHHFEFVDHFANRVKRLAEDPFKTGTKDTSDPVVREKQHQSKADRRMLVQAFLHMADLGKNCSQFKQHSQAVVLIEQEFFNQGDRERDLRLPISPLSDRTKDSAALGQHTFLYKLVLPLLQPCIQCIEKEVGESLMDNLHNNKKSWEMYLEKHGPHTAKWIYDHEVRGAEEDMEEEDAEELPPATRLLSSNTISP